MAKIYLVNPSERNLLDNAGDRLPIGLLSLGGQLRRTGHKVKVWDLNHISQSTFLDNFEIDKPEFTGISVYTSPSYLEAIVMAHRLRDKTKTIAGGYHATFMPETLDKYFDSIVMGEGEETFEEAMKFNGVISPKAPDLENLAFPAYDMVDMSRYGTNQSGRRAGTIITSRGCPFDCSFCGKFSRKVRYEPVGKVRKMIDIFDREGFDSLYFLDDVFTLDKKRMEDILTGIKVPFRVTTRADLIDGDRLDMLKEYGCEWLSMGIESGNNLILDWANKGMTKEQNYEAVKMAGDRGINVKGFFIIGMPYETDTTAAQTIDYSLKLREVGLKQADFYFMTPFPGTAIWEKPEDFGIEIIDRDFTKYLEAGKGAKCYVRTENLSSDRIEQYVSEARRLWKN